MNKQIKPNILIVSSDIPFIGGCGTNSYNLIEKLSNIKRYNIFGLFITNINGMYNPKNFKNIYKINIDYDIEDNLLDLKTNIEKIYNSIDLILIKNYKSFVFINRVFPETKKIFIASGLRYFTYKIENEYITANELLDEKFNSLNFSFDIDLIDKGNIYENVIKYDLFMEKYVFSKVKNILTNSDLTKKILNLSINYDSLNIYNIKTINTTYINYKQHKNIDFYDRQYDLIFIAYNLSRKLKNYKLIYSLLETNMLNGLKILIIGNNKDIIKYNKVNIEYKNYVNNEELIKLLCNTKSLICPSLYDSNPNVVAEGLMCGCNIITSNNIGYYELLNKELIIKNFRDKKEWITKILDSTTKQYTYNNINTDNILNELKIEIDKELYNDTMSLIYNCSNKCNIFYRNYINRDISQTDSDNSQINSDIIQRGLINYNCSEHNKCYVNTCISCHYIKKLLSKNLNLLDLELKIKDIEHDNINININNLYYNLCLAITKYQKYKMFNYVLFNGASGSKEIYNNSKYYTIYNDDITINIFYLNDPVDLIRFCYSKLTFLRGFYDYAHVLFKYNTIFYSAACLELVEGPTSNPIILPPYNKILYHTDRDKNFYEKKNFNNNLIKFNKFNNIINKKINNSRVYDLCYIANGNGVTKNIELFLDFLNYIILIQTDIKIIVICDNELLKKYEVYDNINIIYTSEFNKNIDLDNIYNNTKINITFSLYDYNPRIITEAASYGCYNIFFKQLYSYPCILKDNTSLSKIIDLEKYMDINIINNNILKIDEKYKEYFIPIWEEINTYAKSYTINHELIYKEFNNTYNINNECSNICYNL